jgi:hypothetical protein
MAEGCARIAVEDQRQRNIVARKRDTGNEEKLHGLKTIGCGARVLRVKPIGIRIF